MNYLVYKITHIPTGHFYIGTTNADAWANGYMGSGTRIKQFVAKYGSGAFKREVLKWFYYEEDAYAHESAVIANAKLNQLCLNER